MLGVLHKVACLKLLNCFFSVLDQGALVNRRFWMRREVFDGRQEIAKAIIANFIFPWFLRLLFLVTFLCILGVATSYQDATIRKSYNYGTWSIIRTEIWNQKYQKSYLACSDNSNFATIRRAKLVSFLSSSRSRGIVLYKKSKLMKV